LRARWLCGTVFVKRLVAWPAWWMSCDGDITMVSQDDLMVSTGISPTQYVLGVDLKMGCFCLKLKATENREHDEFPLEGSPILRPTHYLGHWRGTWNCTGLQNWRIPFHGWTHPSHPVVKSRCFHENPDGCTMDRMIFPFWHSEPHIFINLPLKSQIPAWCRYFPFGNPNHTPKDDIRVPYLLGKLGF
jgi:hypothetical protein